MMRVLVCGSRTLSERNAFAIRILDGLCPWLEGLVLIHGGASGADTLASRWATHRNEFHDDPVPIEILAFPADWDRHGKRAGYLRNQQMLDEGQPDLVVAFVDKPLPESKGTAMMIDIARKAGVKTIVVEVL